MVSGVGAVGVGSSGISDELRIRYAELNKSLRIKHLGQTESVLNVPSVSFADLLAQKIAENVQPRCISYEPVEKEPILIAYNRLLAHL